MEDEAEEDDSHSEGDSNDLHMDNRDDDDDSFPSTNAEPSAPPMTSKHRYPRRDRKPLRNWVMAATSPSITITSADYHTLERAMNATPEERDAWLNAIDKEFESIADNKTWEPHDTPKVALLPTHAALNVKRSADGGVHRFKARPVVGGNHQTYGLNYLETYAPVVEFPTVRLFLHLVLYFGLFAGQIDIKSAFLNGNLDDDVWVMSPHGMPGVTPCIYTVKKSLYGVKQAHVAWHTKLC